jgi:hypothetical protein
MTRTRMPDRSQGRELGPELLCDEDDWCVLCAFDEAVRSKSRGLRLSKPRPNGLLYFTRLGHRQAWLSQQHIRYLPNLVRAA